jgi:SAM-dependent methyltransferase
MPTPSVMARCNVGFLSTYANEFVKGRVLDVGCGSKPYRRLFPDCEWTGLDARPVGDIEADMDAYVSATHFDTVLCTDALQFSRDPARAVRNMGEDLAHGGFLVLTVPNCWEEDTISRWRVTVGGLGEMVTNAGLEVVYLDGLSGLFAELADDYRNTFDISASLPASFQGWVDHLDHTYPMLSAVIARKP